MLDDPTPASNLRKPSNHPSSCDTVSRACRGKFRGPSVCHEEESNRRELSILLNVDGLDGEGVGAVKPSMDPTRRLRPTQPPLDSASHIHLQIHIRHIE